MGRISAFVKSLYALNKDFIKSTLHKRKHKIADFNYFQLREQVLDSAPIFVLSTGRGGTKLLTSFFENKNDIHVAHRPNPQLVYHSKLAYEKYQSNPELVTGLFDGSRYELIQQCFLEQKIFLETSNRITFFAHQIKTLYPKAKFVHIIRNPKSFVSSGAIRKWYSGSTKHDDGRIVMSDAAQWQKLDAQAKIAWLWSATNLFIEEFKKNIPVDKIMTIRFEDMTNAEQPEFFMNLIKFIYPKAELAADAISEKLKRPVNQSNKQKLNKFKLEEEKIKPFLDESLLKKYKYQ